MKINKTLKVVVLQVLLISLIVMVTACGGDKLETAYANKDWAALQHLVDEMKAEKPDTPTPHYYLALMNYEQGNWYPAEEGLRKVKELDEDFYHEKELAPLLGRAIIEQVMVGLQDGWSGSDVLQYRSRIKEAHTLNDHYVMARALYGLLMEEEQEYHLADKVLSGVIKEKPDFNHEYINRQLAHFCYGKGRDLMISDLEQAKQWFYTAAKMADKKSAYSLLINMLLTTGSADEVQRLVDEFGKKYPPDGFSIKATNDNLTKYKAFIDQEKAFNVEEIDLAVSQGNNFSSALWLDDSRLVVTVETTRAYQLRTGECTAKILVYNTLTNESSIIFQSNATSGPEMKVIQDGNLALYSEDKLTVLNKDDFSEMWSYDFPDEEIRHYDVSHDGKQLAYTTHEGNTLWVVDLKSGQKRSLVHIDEPENTPPEKRQCPAVPRWSPDDRKITYVIYGWEWVDGIGVIDADGSNNIFKERNGYFSAWYSDASKVIYSTNAYEEESPPIVLDVKTGVVTNLMPNSEPGDDPLPAPDGKDILYQKSVGMGLGLFVYDAENHTFKPACDFVGDASYDWSPDSTKVIYAVGPHYHARSIKLYLLTRR